MGGVVGDRVSRRDEARNGDRNRQTDRQTGGADLKRKVQREAVVEMMVLEVTLVCASDKL